jgi:hypothetical protein
MPEIPQSGMVMMKEIEARRNLRALGQWTGEGTFAEFERRFELGRFRRSHSRNGTEFFDPTMSQS